MNNSQYINNVTFTGAPSSTSPSQLNPGYPGVNFTQPNASITIPFAPGVTPIVAEVSVPSTITNVNQTRVIITAPNGTQIIIPVSPSGTNQMTQFPTEPLPENSTITITFQTTDGYPPQNVTISVIACYTPSSGTTTILTSGTVPTSVTGASSTLIISSTTSRATSGTGENIYNT
jgi:hypothetical protein